MTILGHNVEIRDSDIEISNENVYVINQAILDGFDGGVIVEHGAEHDWEIVSPSSEASSHIVEVTEEFFYSIINSGDKNTEVINKELYTDVIYFKHGVRLLYRSQNGYTNYYIQDINQ